MGVLSKIAKNFRDEPTPVSSPNSPNSPHPSSAFIRNLPTAPSEPRPAAVTPALADNCDTDRPALPPPIPCPLCSCPAVWSTIYEPDIWLCCECDTPPGGPDCDPWHWTKGGWQFVRRRLLLVIDGGKWHWEGFPRLDLRDFAVKVVVEDDF